jgi:hypothetical protein
MILKRFATFLLCIATSTSNFGSAFLINSHRLPRKHRPFLDISHRAHAIEEELTTPERSRRKALSKLTASILALSSSILPSSSIQNTCWAAESSSSPLGSLTSQLQQKAESTELGAGLLEARVTENVLSPPPYGMETNDLFYPSWFQGTWLVSSKTSDIQAPCGIPLFGGNATFERAQREIGTTLTYEARFVADNNGQIIADREYNVNSIAKAAMGQYSVIDIPVATPNKLSCILVPKGSSQMIKVDLIALNRRQETISEIQFDCSEVTREIVAPVNNNNNNNNSDNAVPTGSTTSAPILKEVETTSLYSYIPSKNEIRCQQRSATFLLPSQTSPIAYKIWEAARGRPIDTRFYEVRYTKAGKA